MINKLKNHLLYWRENYLLLPLILLAVYAAIHGVVHLTGRAVIDDPGAIVGMLYNAVGAVLAVCLTGITQKALFGYRSDRFPESFQPGLLDEVLDACTTAFLLLFFAFFLFR